jgi:hypothetical protein
MQKLSGTCSGTTNKRCRIFHNESNKIGFAFFPNFLRYSMEFTIINKTHILLEIQFCNPAPKSFRFHMSRSLPGKNRDDAIGSSATGRRQSGQIPANRRPGPVGRGRRRTREVSWLDFGRSSEWWGRRRGCTAAATDAKPQCPSVPSRSRPGQGIGRLGKFPWVLGEQVLGSPATGKGAGGSSTRPCRCDGRSGSVRQRSGLRTQVAGLPPS